MSLQSFFNVEKSNHIYFEKVRNPKAKKAIIFLHGIVGSRRQWPKKYKELSQKYSLYFIDMLGFGFSAKPDITYTLDAHIEALHTFITTQVKEQSVILVGHSFGAVVALGYLSKYSKNVDKIFLLALPYFHSFQEALTYTKAHTKPQYFVVDTWATKLTCTLWCHFGGPITRRLIPYMLKRLPKEMASDGLLHTYNSYITTLYNVIYRQDIPSLLSKSINKKIFLFHGTKDVVAPLNNIQDLAKKYTLSLRILADKSHNLPGEATEEIYQFLEQLL